MTNWRNIGIGYVVLSIFCGMLLALLGVYFPAMMQQAFQQNPEGIQVDFWPSYLGLLPMGILFGFLLSPILFVCGKIMS